MSGTNLHVFLSNIENETRLFKETQYTLKAGILDRAVVLGLWKEGLETKQRTDFGLEIQRKQTWIRRYKEAGLLRKLPPLRKMVAALSLMQYIASAILAARRIKPDFVSCHNALMLPVCWSAARLSGATLEYLPHELETQRSGLTGLKKKVETWIEKRFIYSARNVVLVNDPIRDWYADAYGLTNLHVVRNVPEKDAITIRDVPDGGFRKNFAIPDTATIFIYQGVFGEPRGTHDLIDMFSRLDTERAHLILMGYGEGVEQTMVEEAAERLPNLHYQPAVPRDWITSYTSGADVGVFITRSPSMSYRYSLPNKFYEYTHAGLPVIFSRNLEYLASIIDENEIGWALELEEIENKIAELAENNVGLSTYRDRTRNFAAEAIWETDADVFRTIYAPKDTA